MSPKQGRSDIMHIEEARPVQHSLPDVIEDAKANSIYEV
jgi:hypothetical protein